MIEEVKFCKNCGSIISEYKRKDSLFCDTPCRQRYWEKIGRRKKKSTIDLILSNQKKDDSISIKKSGDQHVRTKQNTECLL